MRAVFFACTVLATTLSAPTFAVDIWSTVEDDEPRAYKILQLIEDDVEGEDDSEDGGGESSHNSQEKTKDAERSSLVIFQGGQDQGILPGSIFKTYRISTASRAQFVHGEDKETPTVWIETGRIKAVDVQQKYTIAEVEMDTTSMSRKFFPDFSGIMVGDLAVQKRVRLARRQSVTPTVALSYFDLFEDPKTSPMTFELSRKGRDEIRRATEPFRKARLSLLMVEGYTDHKGPSSANQVESYQRALTVRQFLIDELGFDESRVMAVGYGETELVDATMAPGYVMANRRIVFKAVPVN